MPTIPLRLRPDGVTLFDPGTTEVHQDESVVWEIVAGEDIESFVLDHKHLHPPHPFTSNPHQNPHARVPVVVRRDAQIDSQWSYSIRYKIRSTQEEFTLDPIIAVKPRKHFHLIAKAVSLLFAVAAFIGVSLWLGKRNKDRS